MSMLKEEIFRTQDASVAQCDSTESFFLTFDSEEIEFQLCDLVTFRNKIRQIDVVELLIATLQMWKFSPSTLRQILGFERSRGVAI